MEDSSWFEKNRCLRRRKLRSREEHDMGGDLRKSRRCWHFLAAGKVSFKDWGHYGQQAH